MERERETKEWERYRLVREKEGTKKREIKTEKERQRGRKEKRYN